MPPVYGSFSSRATVAPSSCAERAAAMPARPEPTTTTSTETFCASPSGAWARCLCEKARTASTPPASSSAAATAVMMPRLVNVAPAHASTPMPWPSTMRAGSVSMAESPTLNVSLASVTVTEEMASPVTTTSTLTSLWWPCAVASYVPASSVADSGADGAARSASASPPACATQSATASSTAFVDIVAPETASTFSV